MGTVRGRGEVFITTHDRDRKIGALYRMIDGRPVLFAGGTPTDGGPPLLRLPEGVAVDATGHVYVADRDQGAVVRLDPTGRVVHPRYVSLLRPRTLAIDERGQLWIAGDGTAETPWQDGAGEIWRVSPEDTPGTDGKNLNRVYVVATPPVSEGEPLAGVGRLTEGEPSLR